MTILIPEAHDALADAVAARKAARGARRLWPRRSRRATAATAIGIAVVSGAALAATTGWHPVLGGDAGGGGTPLEAHGPVPQDQLRALAVLRRPQSEADRAPEVQAALRLFRRQDVNGIHVDAIRVVRRRADAVVMLVPVERLGSSHRRDHFPLRRDVLCLVSVTPAHWRFAASRSETASVPPRSIGTTFHCGDVRELRRTGLLESVGWRLEGVVPDGVARVVTRVSRYRRVSVRVRDNYFELPPNRSLTAPGATTWLDAAGRVVHAFGPGVTARP